MPQRSPNDESAHRRASSSLRMVLVATEHPGNIGAAVRAMDVMGLSDLWLVSPKRFPDPMAERMAAESRHLLASVTVVDSLSAAIDDCALAVAATRRSRQRFWPECDVSQALQRAHDVGRRQPVAVVFGPEPSGLTTEQVHACDLQAFIPTPENAGSLNLAQAVQVFAWEWFRLGPRQSFDGPVEEWATVGQRHELAELVRSLLTARLADPDAAARSTQRLRALWQRGGLTASDWRLLNGLLRNL